MRGHVQSKNNLVFILQDFARNKAIPQGEDQVVYFPPVWDWSQQFSIKDQTLFNNPMYVGKGAACVQNGEVKTFKRTKVWKALSFLLEEKQHVALCVLSILSTLDILQTHFKIAE